MPREAPATAIAVGASLCLSFWGSPAEHAWLWAVGMVAWSTAVIGLLHDSPSAFPRNGTVLWGALFAAAVAVRVPLLLSQPTLSDDVYRYVWEGRVWAAGLSPVEFAPNATELATLRDANWALVNHRDVSTIYPPLAQLLALLLAPGGVIAFRIFMAACDVLTALVLARRSARIGWIWALLPLPAVESAVSGHLEGAGLLLVAIALTTRWKSAAAAAWAGAMIKLLPAVLLARRSLRTQLIAAVATVLAAWPMLGPELFRGFETYRAHWSYNGSIYPLLAAAIGDPSLARRVLQGVGVVVVATALWRGATPARLALWTFGSFVALSPTVHPWYGLWPLLPALLLGIRAWIWLAALLPLTYVVLASYQAETGGWTEPWWTSPAIYLPFYALLLYDAGRSWRFPSGGPPAPDRPAPSAG